MALSARKSGFLSQQVELSQVAFGWSASQVGASVGEMVGDMVGSDVVGNAVGIGVGADVGAHVTLQQLAWQNWPASRRT